jgi:hypothetical protein
MGELSDSEQKQNDPFNHRERHESECEIEFSRRLALIVKMIG